MNRFNLAEMANQKPGTRKRLGAVFSTVAAERRYQVALNRVIKAIETGLRDEVLPAYARNGSYADGLVRDDVADWFIAIKRRRDELLAFMGGLAAGLANDEADRHSRRWIGIVKARTSVDLTAVVRAEDLEDYMRDYVSRQVGLITSLHDDLLRNAERIVMQGVLGSRQTNDVRKDLMKALGISRRRAKLIARDQMAKMMSELNAIRQVQAGVTHYEWSTARDERVRPRHADIDGKIYKHGEPTGAEDGLPPGQPINCRCVGLAVLEG